MATSLRDGRVSHVTVRVRWFLKNAQALVDAAPLRSLWLIYDLDTVAISPSGDWAVYTLEPQPNRYQVLRVRVRDSARPVE